MERIVARRDLAFLLYDWLAGRRGSRSAPRYRDHSARPSTPRSTPPRQIATDLFAPHNRKADLDEPRFDGETVHLIPEIKAALDAFVAAGLMAAEHDEEFGGMQLPLRRRQGLLRVLQGRQRRDQRLRVAHRRPTPTCCSRTATPRRSTRSSRPQLAGRFFGTMCLSEPQAGSSLADVATRAVRRRLAARRALPADRQQDVDLGRRTRAVREHRAPGAGEDPRRRRHACWRA